MKSLGVPSFDRTWGKATDICLIAEGCYPHVTGGVSSWIDWLMRNLPDYSFSVVSLVSGDESRTSRYPFPPNLLHFVELDLKGPGPSQRFGRRLKVSSAQVDDFTQALWRLVQKGGIDTLADVVSAMDKFPRRPTYQDLTQSEFAWDVVCGMYRRIMPEASFIDFFWAWQSLVGGLFATLTFNLPQARIYHTISTGYAGILAARAAIDTNCRTLITEHGIYTNERRIEILTADWIVDTIDNGLATDNRLMDIRDLWIKAFESYARTCYDACDTITTLYGDNQKLQLELGADRDRLKIIPNGIDVDRFGAVRPETWEPAYDGAGWPCCPNQGCEDLYLSRAHCQGICAWLARTRAGACRRRPAIRRRVPSDDCRSGSSGNCLSCGQGQRPGMVAAYTCYGPEQSQRGSAAHNS